MGFVDEFVSTWKKVVFSPSTFFEEEERRDGLEYPIRFALTNLLISGLISAAALAVFGSVGAVFSEMPAVTAGTALVAAAASLIFAPIVGLISLAVSAGITHIFVYLLEGEAGLEETFAVWEYASAIIPLSSVAGNIPILNYLLGPILALYTFYIQIQGLKAFQGLSTGKAVAAILLPVLIIMALIVGTVMVVFFGALAGLGAM